MKTTTRDWLWSFAMCLSMLVGAYLGVRAERSHHAVDYLLVLAACVVYYAVRLVWAFARSRSRRP